MSEKYTPEKVAELVAEARRFDRAKITHDLADALTAVSAELEHLKRFDWLKQNKRAEAERDRTNALKGDEE